MKLINEILSDYNAVVIPNNKHLTFYPASEYGQRTEEQIRYKYNTDEVSFDIDTYSLKTQIKGYGKLKDGANTENPKDSDYVFTLSLIRALNQKNGELEYKTLLAMSATPYQETCLSD